MDNILQELFIDGLSVNNIENTPECIRIELNSTKETQECPMYNKLSVSKHCTVRGYSINGTKTRNKFPKLW